MQLQDLPIPAVALKIAIDCNPLRITPDTFLIDAIALMSQERISCGLGSRYSFQEQIENPKPTDNLYHKSSNFILKCEEPVSCVLVMEEEQLVGLLTQRDFIRLVAQRINLDKVKAADVMTRHLITLNQSDIRDSLTILNLFREHGIHHLPILNDEGKVVGIVTSDSLINGLQDQLNQYRQMIASLHAEKIELWENRQTELEKQASDRTAELARLNAQLRQQIQEREGMETALQQEFDLLARIMETSPVGIVMVNPKGQIILASDQAQRVLGLTKEEIGKRAYKAVIEQISDQDGNVLLEDDLLFRQVMTTEQAVYDVRHAIKCPDGRRVLLSINGAPLFDIDDQLKGVVFAIEDVTERVRAEEELRQTKNQLEVILEGTADGINVLDPTGRLIYVNEAGAKAAGYASAQVMLQEFDSHKVFDQFEIVDESGEAFPLDQLPGRLALQGVQRPATTVRFRIKTTGEERWSSIKATPIFDSQGNVRFSVIVTHDITELKQAEEALRQSEERFRTVADFTYDWEYWIDPDGNFIYISPSCDRTTGYRVDEFLNNPSLLQSIIHPDDRTTFAQHRCEDGNTQKASIIDFRITTKQGDIRWIAHICQAVYSADGRCLGVRASNRDITDRKRAEESLRESEERFRSIFNQAGVGIVQTDLSGHFLVINQKFIDIVHYTLEEVQQKTFQEITHPQDLVEELAYLRQLLAGQIQTFSIEKRYLRQDGSAIWTNVSVSLVQDSLGQPNYLIGVVKDISDRKRTEAALQESESTLRSFYNSAAMMMGIVEVLDDDIRHISDNIAATKFFGRAPEAMRYQLASQIGVPQGILRQWIGHYQESKRTGHPVRFEYPHPTKTDIRWLSATVCPISAESEENGKMGSGDWGVGIGEIGGLGETKIQNPKFISAAAYSRSVAEGVSAIQNPKSPRFCYVVEDITERKQAEEALQHLNEELTGWVSELRTRNREMVLLGEMSDFLQACQTVEEAYSAIATLIEPLFPGTSGAVFAINSSNHWVDAMATWGTHLASQTLFTPSECWALRRGRLHGVNQGQSGLLCRHIHQNPSPAESLCMPMMAQGNALGVLYLNSVEAGQLTEAKQRLAVTVAEHLALSLANLQLHETLAQQSIRDPLTGLFNRRYMEESLEREIHSAHRKKRPMGIMMLDIDHFKRFNDTFGHEAGDAILRELGIFLQQNIRGSDIACRYGGEELILILPEASLEDTRQRAEQIRQGVKHLAIRHRSQLLGAITVSVGVSGFPENGLTAEALIEAADAALYQAKAKGRDLVVPASV